MVPLQNTLHILSILVCHMLLENRVSFRTMRNTLRQVVQLVVLLELYRILDKLNTLAWYNLQGNQRYFRTTPYILLLVQLLAFQLG